MKNHKDFEIAFVGLKPGKHEFFYTLGSEELEEFGSHFELEEPEASIRLELEKMDSFLDLKFENTLKAKAVCDRCMEPLELEIWDEFKMIVKYSTHADEENATNDQDDIVFISRGESSINIYEWVIEMLALMVPMTKTHDLDQCDPKSLKILEDLNPKDDKKEDIWGDLKNLKFDN